VITWRATAWRVSVESDGAQAAARIIAEQPDLVILDLMLPGEDGLSICRKVRERYDGVILMLTARTDDMDQVLGLDMGADDYVCKPVRPRLLLARIQALCARERAGGTGRRAKPRRLQFAACSWITPCAKPGCRATASN